MNCGSNALPLRYDLKMYRGDTYRRGVRLRQLESEEPFDLTGCSVLAQIRRHEEDNSILYTLNAMVDPDQITNKGGLWFEFPSSAFTQLGSESGEIGIWDLQITWPSGDVSTYLKGKVVIEGDVSRV